MKLDKSKVGIFILALILSMTLIFSGSFVVFGDISNDTLDGEVLTIDTIKPYTGNYLSNILTTEFGKDDAEDIEIIEFDLSNYGDSLEQTASLTVDIPVTIRPADLEETVTLSQTGSTDAWGYAGTDSGSAASIFVASDGVTLQNIAFEPNVEFNNSSSAIAVDCCVQGERELIFENLTIAEGGNQFDFGVKFSSEDQDQSCGIGGGLNYTDGIDIYSVKMDDEAISNSGIYFAKTVGDVENLSIGRISAENLTNGVAFENSGYLRDVSISDSSTVSADPFIDSTLLDGNDYGVMVNGTNVTKIEDFLVDEVKIQNGKSGIFVDAPTQTNSDTLPINGFTVSRSEITGNSEYGIEVADDGDSGNVNIKSVLLDELLVKNNTEGGAIFNVKWLSPTQDEAALKVTESQFNPDETDESSDNAQDFGLKVDTEKEIIGVSIKDSDFYGHGSSSDNGTGSGNGVELVASDDDVEWVRIENSSAEYNEANGVKISGRRVKDVEINSPAKAASRFSSNDSNGILIDGTVEVSKVLLKGRAEDGKVLANSNEEYGLNIKSEESIRGIFAENAEFGNVDNPNKKSGARLFTSNAESMIGGSNAQEAISFYNVLASGNSGHGISVVSEGSFENPADDFVIESSVLNHNDEDGLYLEALELVKNPRVKSSEFVGNKDGSVGISIISENVKGDPGVSEIKNNVVADNKKGIVVGDSGGTYADISSIVNFTIEGNTTKDEDVSGNSIKNMHLEADDLNAKILNNDFIGSTDTGIALHLVSCDTCSQSTVLVKGNKFDSEASGSCQGNGTAIRLDALGVTIEKNTIMKYSTALDIDQDADNSDNTSNHINKNNIEGCCTLINAEDTSSPVDATDNYWDIYTKHDKVTKDDLKANMIASTSNPLDQISVDPLRDEPVTIGEGEVSFDFSITPEEPDVEPVELEYTMTNNTNSDLDLDEVRLTITDTEVDDELLESDVTVGAGDSWSGIYEFTPEEGGSYTAEITANGYSGSYDFQIGAVVTDKPNPYWGQDGDRAESGILPAPVDGDEKPFLELANEDGDSVHSYVTVNKLRVYDLSGNKLATIDSGFDDLSALENMENGLYLYTVDYEVDTEDGVEDKKSPVMKFIVKQ